MMVEISTTAYKVLVHKNLRTSCSEYLAIPLIVSFLITLMMSCPLSPLLHQLRNTVAVLSSY